MENCKFIGVASGNKNGRNWYCLFVARYSDKYGHFTCWGTCPIEETEFTELSKLKFGTDILCHFFNGQLKSYELKK